jgi:outer membrane beta-barrel protein
MNFRPQLLAAITIALAFPAAAAADEAPTEAAAAETAAGAAAAETGSPGLRTTEACIDAEIADRLAIKRQRRGAIDRLFVKQARHEITVGGGYYVSDLFSATYGLGGSYTYHMTENTAVEFSYLWTRANADVIRAIEDDRGQVIDDELARIQFFESLLRWSPVYAKLRLGGHIARFDIHLDGGVGVVDSPTSRGVVGVGGVGMQLFMGKAFALRLDARDHVFVQELLAESFIVNDLSLTLGVSIFLPLRN